MAGRNVGTFVLAGVLTVVLFVLIFSMNSFLSTQRESTVSDGMDDIIEEIEDIDASYYLIEYLETQNDTCDVLIDQLNYLESRLWKFDERIRRYRETQEEFTGDEFYNRQKRRLNRREIIQMTLLERVKRNCGYNQTLILYFYGDCKTVPNCGEQGFVLSYINEKIDDEISILSFDGDRNTEVVRTLMKALKVDRFPCIVVEGQSYCGLRDRDQVEAILCEKSPSLSICN